MFNLVPVVVVLLLVALPLSARRRGLHAAMVLAAIAWVVVAVFGVLATDFLASLFYPNTGRTLHDTYYVVSHFHYQLSIAAIMTLLAAGAWLARPLSSLATFAFWVMHFAVAATVIPQYFIGTFAVPDDTFAFAERLEALNTLSTAASAVTLGAGLTLIISIVLGIVRRVRQRH